MTAVSHRHVWHSLAVWEATGVLDTAFVGVHRYFVLHFPTPRTKAQILSLQCRTASTQVVHTKYEHHNFIGKSVGNFEQGSFDE